MAIGIVIGNLGTPQSPSPADVKVYLQQFLMDPYVINRPTWQRWLLVNGIIAPTRSKKSAEAYQSVWREDGSPLLAITKLVADKLSRRLGHDYRIEIGMRYGEPSTFQALERLKACEKILLFPQYPQYAESSYRTWMEDALAAAKKLGIGDRLCAVEPFYDRPEYLAPLVESLRSSLAGHGYDHLLVSFHGLPESHVNKFHRAGGDCEGANKCTDGVGEHNERCYRAQCYFVAKHIARQLGLDSQQFTVAFQSRLGREPWLKPFTDQILRELPGRGIKKLAVAVPSFTVDCLETLEEIHIRARRDFMDSGGEQFYTIPCLNDGDAWIHGLAQIIEKSLAAPVKPCP